MKRRLSTFVGALTLAAASACGGPVPSFPKTPAPVAPHRAATVSVGTGRADVTMTPGAATFGHALDSRVADGFWTRTYCRVFYFESSLGQRLALVPCDLPAISALLQRRVAEQLTDVLHVSQLMMTATHTHAGVGHYFGAAQYTDVFSSRAPAFDEKLLDELAKRVATAVRHAARCARPAKLAWAHRNDFWCLTRNRSLDAFRMNRPPFVAPGAPGCALGDPERLAVDPALNVLRIDEVDLAAPEKLLPPIGSLSFFAMHPTVVDHTNQFFGGDTSGVVSRDIERRLRQTAAALPPPATNDECHGDPLHGVVNTNEGDISPIWSSGDIDEAISVGDQIASKVWNAHPPHGSGATAVVVDSRYAEENMRDARFVDLGQNFSLCKYAQLGQGAARGAPDHPTSVQAIPMFGTEPVADYGATDCHAPKLPLLRFVSAITRPKGQFPSDVPLAVAQLGDTVLSFVPAEMTITAGERLNRRVLSDTKGYADSPTHAIVAGLANEYVQYVTTEEEYELQAYEGASTLYGPNSARYFANRMALLARSMFDPTTAAYAKTIGLELGQARDMAFGFGPNGERFAQPTGDEVARKHLGTCVMPNSRDPIGWGETPARRIAPRICVRFRDNGPGDVPLREAGWIRLVFADSRKPVRACLRGDMPACDPQGFVDDRSEAFRTRIHQELGGGWVWSTLFAPSFATWSELASTSVRVEVGGPGPAVRSQPFSQSCMPPRCSVEEARLCMEGERTRNWKGIDAIGP